MSTRLALSRASSADRSARAAFALDVRYYLTLDPRQLPSRYLYDDLGSCLFEAIGCLPWYPVKRAETRLLAAHNRDIFAAVDPLTHIVELGPGSGEKLKTVIEGRRASRDGLNLHLIDVSPTALELSARTLSTLEDVRVFTYETAYENGLVDVRAVRQPRERTLVLFLGSNLGNFDPPSDEAFLRDIRRTVGPGDSLLLGTDLIKPEAQLQLAYDDPLGVTAAFNFNLLVRMNRELGGNFDLSAFSHRARWNAAASRIEMHLVSRRRQAVRVEAADLDFTLEEGEWIWTESSYKYEPTAVMKLVERAGFVCRTQWIDADDPFALTLAEPA